MHSPHYFSREPLFFASKKKGRLMPALRLLRQEMVYSWASTASAEETSNLPGAST